MNPLGRRRRAEQSRLGGEPEGVLDQQLGGSGTLGLVEGEPQR
jgi:hypothetical protein